MTVAKKAQRRYRAGNPLKRQYDPATLQEIFNFCQHDFDRFLRLLVWLEDLT